MTANQRGHWIFFILGVPNLVGGLARWSSRPQSTLEWVGFFSGIALVAMGVGIWWLQRKTAVAEGSSTRT